VVFAGKGEGDFLWRVIKLKPADGVSIPVVGRLPRLDEGQDIKVEGEWHQHPRHGMEFRAKKARFPYLGG
jgi:hypothetical protein